jgi:hypothetical protein
MKIDICRQVSIRHRGFCCMIADDLATSALYNTVSQTDRVGLPN